MRYFSTKAGALCTRYGTGTYIGAAVSVVDGAVRIAYDEKEIAAISDQEIALYGREYEGLLLEGSLVEKQVADFEAWQKDVAAAAEKEAADAAEKLVKAAEEAAAKLAKDTAAKTETTKAPSQSGADSKAES